MCQYVKYLAASLSETHLFFSVPIEFQKQLYVYLGFHVLYTLRYFLLSLFFKAMENWVEYVNRITNINRNLTRAKYYLIACSCTPTSFLPFVLTLVSHFISGGRENIPLLKSGLTKLPFPKEYSTPPYSNLVL